MKIDGQIKCVKDEIKRREKIFPKLIENGKLDKNKAFIEIGIMKQVFETLTQLKGIVK